MRQNVHDTVARFRINHRLLTAAEIEAERKGMSLSELMRHALRRELEAA